MLQYILHTQIIWLLCYIPYVLWFRHYTFFSLNRAYLLMALLLGLALPLVQVYSNIAPLMEEIMPTIILPELNISTAPESPSAFNITRILSTTYMIGVYVMLFFFSKNIYQLWRLATSSTRATSDSHISYQLQHASTPFSFFHFLFWYENPNWSIQERSEILRHELAHIEQGHSWDVLLLEILKITCWFSPLVYMMERALRVQHEYLADAAVLGTLHSPKQYGRLLISQSMNPNASALANHFLHSQLKKRILMMTKNPSSPLTKWRYASVLPLLLMLLCIQPNQLLAQAAQKGEILEEVDILPEFEGGQANMMQFLIKNMRYPQEAHTAKQEGKVYVSFVVNTDGSISDATIKKSVSPSCDAEALRVVNSMPAWKAGQKSGKAVRTRFILPLKFKLNG